MKTSPAVHVLWISALVSAAAWGQTSATKRSPIKLEVKSSQCPLEFKPMDTKDAAWQPYREQLPAGTRIQGFTDAQGTITFRADRPKNFFFRGSLDCLNAKKSFAPAPSLPTTVAASPSPTPSGPIFGLSFWIHELTLDATDPAFPNEAIRSLNFAVNLGYSQLLYHRAKSSAGFQLYTALGLSFLSNQNKAFSTKFTGKGIVGTAVLRPYYYYDLGNVAIGPLVALTGQYGVYGSTEDGKITKPFSPFATVGLSLRVSRAGHTLDIGLGNLKPSRLSVAANFIL